MLIENSSVFLHCLSRQTFENNRESASLLVKSPNLTKRICEARRQLIYVGCLSVRVSRRLAMPTRVHGRQPTFYNQ